MAKEIANAVLVQQLTVMLTGLEKELQDAEDELSSAGTQNRELCESWVCNYFTFLLSATLDPRPPGCNVKTNLVIGLKPVVAQ